MTRGDVVFSLVDYAKEFVREYKNSTLEQKVIDAIIVDFLNYFALLQCGMDLAMYTKDLRDGKKMREEGTILQKGVILCRLNFHKRQYDKCGIVNCVNRNHHMNECGGTAEFNNAEAVKLIEAFIEGYMAA